MTRTSPGWQAAPASAVPGLPRTMTGWIRTPAGTPPKAVSRACHSRCQASSSQKLAQLQAGVLALVPVTFGRHPSMKRDQERVVVPGEVGGMTQRVHAAR
jgi:hypothetical protein